MPGVPATGVTMTTHVELKTSPKRIFTAIKYVDEKGGFVAECPEVRTAGQGETRQGALEDRRQATRVFLMDFLPPKASSLVTQFHLHA